MPTVSARQKRAMYAAAEGKSRLGIPASVGKEFIAQDGEPQGAGIMFVAPDGDILLLRRAADAADYPGHWGLPGGIVEEGEVPRDAASRESIEEMGVDPDDGALRMLDRRRMTGGPLFTTFARPVDKKFFPKLNGEHQGFAWAPMHQLPTPLHPGVKATLHRQLGMGEDMTPEDWDGLKNGFIKWVNEEETESEHAEDANWNESDHPRASNGEFGAGGEKGRKNSTPDLTHLHALETRLSHEREYLRAAKTPKDKAFREHQIKMAQKEIAGERKFLGLPEENLDDLKDLSDEELLRELTSDSRFGKLNEKERAEADRGHAKREEMPADVFLEPGARKYPVKEKVGGEYRYSRNLLLAAAREARMHGHEDLASRADAIRKKEFGGAQDSAIIAMDRNTARTYDADNRMHVAITNISKAAVNPYLGREIPDFEKLGLDPAKQYRLLRDPEELAKAAPTFNNLPLLSRHAPTNANDHQPHLVIGSTGTDASFEAPYLKNSLVVWSQDAIEAIESEIQKELSSAYRYRADMTPGTYEGEPYDGVMRDIIGNHVALVREGRAGSDVVVGDEKPEELKNMSKTVLSRKAAVAKGVILAALQPKLAQDAKITSIDITPVLKSITAKNFSSQKGAIVAGVTKIAKPFLAQDASLEDMKELLNVLDSDKIAEGADEDPETGLPMSAEEMDEAKDAEPHAKLRAHLATKGMSPEEVEEAIKMIGSEGAEDEDDDEDGTENHAESEEKISAKDKKAKDAKIGKDGKKAKDAGPAMQPPGITKTAMDAALKDQETRITRRFTAIREAERAVAPWTGALNMAFDSAEDVYKHALTTMEVDIEGVHPSAYPALLKMVPQPGAKKASGHLAMDSAVGADSFSKMYPDAGRIGNA